MRGGLRHPCGAVLLGEMGSKEVVCGKKKAKESCGEGGKQKVPLGAETELDRTNDMS